MLDNPCDDLQKQNNNESLIAATFDLRNNVRTIHQQFNSPQRATDA